MSGREGAWKERGRVEDGREEARGGWEGTRGGREGRMEGGSDDAMQGESVNGRREGGLMKGTSEEGTERGMDAARESRKRVEKGLSEEGRETSREVVYSQTNHSHTGPCDFIIGNPSVAG